MENMKETVVREDGHCFYRAVLLWNDMSTDRIHVTILKGARESQNSIISRGFSGVFVQFLYCVGSFAEEYI